MMELISVLRDPARKRFTNRSEYYQYGPAQAREERICRLVEQVLSPVDLNAARASGLKWRDLPWLTLVLGSGCVEMTDQAKGKLAQLGAAVARAVTDLLDDEKRDYADEMGHDAPTFWPLVARSFTESLILDRMQTERPLPDGAEAAPGQVTLTPLTARMLLLSGMLTNFFFDAKAISNKPLTRLRSDIDETDEAVLPTRAELSAAIGGIGVNSDAVEQLGKDCQWHCTRAVEQLQPDNLLGDLCGAVRNLIEEIESGLGGGGRLRAGRSIRRNNLRLLTEVAWYLATNELGDYYSGWSEILFGLLLSSKPPLPTINSARPHFDRLRGHASDLNQLMEKPTVRSWEQPRTDMTRTDLFASAARLLWAQSGVVTDVLTDVLTDVGNGQGPAAEVPPPPAAAFVTSFDIELDMAVWRAAPDGASYFVVIPAHLFRGNGNFAQPCWIRGEVRKSNTQSGLETLRRPVGWELLSAQTKPDELRRGPHIIHLNGAPLISLDALGAPEIRQLVEDLQTKELSKERIETIAAQASVEHAIFSDEYLALRHAEVDLLFQFGVEKDAGNRTDRSLPRLLTGSSMDRNDGSGVNPRFWLMMGVALADPSVRYRLISQLSLARSAFRSPSRAALPGPSARDAPGQEAPATLGNGGNGGGATHDPSDLFGLQSTPQQADAGVGAAGADERGADGLADEEDDELNQTREGRYTGIVVNWRIADDEASTLYWLGFDVVKDTAVSFAPDIAHYTDHLASGGWQQWPGYACEIGHDGNGNR